MTASMSYMDDSLHVTSVKIARTQPGKKTINKGVLYNQNVCQVSHVKHASKADISKTPHGLIAEAKLVNGG